MRDPRKDPRPGDVWVLEAETRPLDVIIVIERSRNMWDEVVTVLTCAGTQERRTLTAFRSSFGPPFKNVYASSFEGV